MKLRPLVLSLIVAAAATLPHAAALGGAPPTACSLLTQDEVVTAFGAPIGVVGDEAAMCTFGTDPLAMVAANLVVELRPGDPAAGAPIDQARAAEPGATDLTLGGVPALLGPAEAGPTGGSLQRLHLFPDADTWVVLTGDTTATLDLAATLSGLAELMLPRLGVVAAPEGLCDLWSVDQVSTALGGERLRIDRDAAGPLGCRYEGRGRASNTEFAMGLGFGRPEDGPVLDVIVQNFPEAVAVTLTDPTVTLLHRPPQEGVGEGKGYLYTTFFLIPDPSTILQIQVIAPKAVDAVAGVTDLVEAALPVIRTLGTLAPPAPTPTPSPEPVGDIATLFPAEIGGGAVDVQPQENRLAGQSARSVRALQRQLDRQDRALDEFRFAIGGYPSGDLILVVQLPGGRMAPLESALRDAMGIGGEGRTTTVAGKEVRVIEPYHVYVKGDALWAVSAQGPTLEEIFQKLP